MPKQSEDRFVLYVRTAADSVKGSRLKRLLRGTRLLSRKNKLNLIVETTEICQLVSRVAGRDSSAARRLGP